MVKIVTDTTSGLTLEQAAQLGIPFIPQIIVFGNENYRDDTEIDTKTFLAKLRTSPSLPKTAAPPPALYNPIYQEAVEKGESVIVICPSAEVSGTVRSATIAAQDFPGADIRVFDTRTIAGGLASMVLQANEWAKEGLDADTIMDKLGQMSRRHHIYFLVDTLEYLYKGGRIGGAAALVGSILQVKPILTLRNGRAEPFESQRTKKRALARLIEIVEEKYPKSKPGYLSVMRGEAEEEAKALAEQLSTQLAVANVPLYLMPPAILVHAGPGVLAVSFFAEEDNV